MSSRYNKQINDDVQVAVDLHLHPEHGAPYWIKRLRELGMDYDTACRELQTVEDLQHILGQFDEDLLRRYPVTMFVPEEVIKKGRLRVFQSGGATGPRKNIPWDPRTYNGFVEEACEILQPYDVPRGMPWLYVGPTGPQLIADSVCDSSWKFGGYPYKVSVDTVYVKKLATKLRDLGMRVGIPRDATSIQRILGIIRNPSAIRYIPELKKTAETMQEYMRSVFEQVVPVLQTQKPGVLMTTAKLLTMLPEYLPEGVAPRDIGIQFIFTGGTSNTEEEARLVRELFGVPWIDVYGNTYWGGSFEDPENHIYTPPKIPRTIWRVVDENTMEDVPYNKEGRVLFTLLSYSLLLPMVLERDLATRERPAEEGESDRVSGIHPRAGIVEGVY